MKQQLMFFWNSLAFSMIQQLGSKITADGDCSHEIKRCLLLGRKAMTNLDCILKSRVFWTLWEREGGMIWENGIETCIISYKKWTASLGSMQDTGCLGQVHWDDPERWYGEGGGRGGSGLGTHVHPWWIHVDVWPNQYSVVKWNKVK